jgi:hypothetical protein
MIIRAKLTGGPATFAATQTYLLLCLPYGGVDLESFKLRSWTQAASILWQVATSLERAELSWNFEVRFLTDAVRGSRRKQHRDLHWGNILIETFPIEQDLSIAQKLETHATPLRRSAGDDWPGRLEPARTGVKACIIDYTLSSANSATGDRRWFGGCDEEELFEGSGDIQFDVYRMMRTATKGDWEGFHPVTNLMVSGLLLDRRRRLTKRTVATLPSQETASRQGTSFGSTSADAPPRHTDYERLRQWSAPEEQGQDARDQARTARAAFVRSSADGRRWAGRGARSLDGRDCGGGRGGGLAELDLLGRLHVLVGV